MQKRGSGRVTVQLALIESGGATDLFVARVPYHIIKKRGRWVSDAAMIYYRDDEDVVNAVFEAFRDLQASRRRI